jgi:5-formyltetrahydrofolate cyclo-ligase
MPGLGFTRDRVRLGHGRGYYDKYLAKAFKRSSELHRNRPYTVAIALNEQIVSEELPHTEHDVKPDKIVTADRVY